MSRNYLNKFGINYENHKGIFRNRYVRILLITAMMFGTFYASQYLLIAVFWIIQKLGLDLSAVNENVLNTLLAVVVYVISLLVFVSLLKLINIKLSRKEVAGEYLPTWKDIGLSLLGILVYMILSVGLLSLVKALVPGFDEAQQQEVGFSNLYRIYEFVLAFFTLIILAPIAEEILFRGYFLGALLKEHKPWVAVIIVSIMFGLIHGAWNVGLDTFALSLVLCTLRINTGSLWPGILVHMLKNSVAFYLLFVNPNFLNTLGG